MSQPHPPASDPAGPWGTAPAPASSQGWPQPTGGEWEVRTPTWQPGPPMAQPPPTPPARPGRSTLFLIGLAALLGTLAGAVGAAFLVANVVVDGADIGAEIAEEMESAMRDGIADGMADGMRESIGDLEELYGGMYDQPAEDVEQFPPAPFEGTGSDPEFDGYAQECFEGDLGTCDELLWDSPPMSDYEDYASTCGGRVKPFAVYSCTELE